MTERAERDRTVGGGYDYQWDLAAYLVAARAFGRPASTGDSALDGAFDWLGKVASVHFEGEAQDGAAEDVTFHGAEARRLHLQIKEREPGSSWTTGKDDIKKFLLRVGSRAQDVPTRVLFVSNVSADKKLRDLPGSADRLDRFFSGPLSWYARRGEEPTALPDRDDFSVRVATVEFVCSEIEPTAQSPEASLVGGLSTSVPCIPRGLPTTSSRGSRTGRSSGAAPGSP